MKKIVWLLLIAFVNCTYALPFTVNPVGDLPTGEIQGKPVAAAYTVTNITSRSFTNIFANLPPNVYVASGGCGSPFNLAAGANCTLNLSITGPVNAQDPNPSNHLFICLSGGTSCAGTNSPLNVTALTTPMFLYIGSNTTGGMNYCSVSMDTGDLSACTTTGSGVFSNPSWLAFSLSGQRAYITDLGQSPAVVWLCNLNTTTGALSGCRNSGATGLTAPVGMVLNAAGTRAYITNSTADTVTLCNVNLLTGILSGCADSGAGGVFHAPEGITLNPTNTIAYIVNSNNGVAGSIAWCQINSSTGQLSTCSSLGGFVEPFDIVLIPSGTQAYITDRTDNKVHLCNVNTTTGALSGCQRTGTSGSYSFSSPAGITLSTNRGQPAQIYVSNQGTGIISLCNYCAINCDTSQTPGELLCRNSSATLSSTSVVGVTLS